MTMTQEERNIWSEAGLKYAKEAFKDIQDPHKATWMRDALYVAFMRGIEHALGKRLI